MKDSRLLTPEEETAILLRQRHMDSSERRHLYGRFKGYVAHARNVVEQELLERKKHLFELLENEYLEFEKKYKSDFLSRVDRDVQRRLQAIDLFHKNIAMEKGEYLRVKALQLNNDCYEVRQAMRHAEEMKGAAVLREQIQENRRRKNRDCERERFWMRVEQIRNEKFDESVKEEKNIQAHHLASAIKDWDSEVAYKKRQVQQEIINKRKEAIELNEQLEELKREELAKFGEAAKEQHAKKAYGDILKQQMAEKEEAKKQQADKEADDFRNMVRELQRLEQEERFAIWSKKRAWFDATMDFFRYLKVVRTNDANNVKMYQDIKDEETKVHLCTKSNVKAMLEAKARIAAAAHEVLKKQICEEYEKRLREEAERREQKILCNPFIHPEPNPEDKIKEIRKNRERLDSHLAAVQSYRKAEQEKYENGLKISRYDHAVCDKLAEDYKRNAIDSEWKHNNWGPIMCYKQYEKPVEVVTESDTYTQPHFHKKYWTRQLHFF